MAPIKILIIATSHGQMGNTNRKTGLWLEEIAVPYYIFKDAGAILTLASPGGGLVPLDPKSESIIVSNSTTRRLLKDPETITLMENSFILDTQKAEDFDLVFLPGGHGPMWDFCDNRPLKQLLEDFNRLDRLIGAVSHGVAGLVPLENKLGEPLVKGRRLTAFSNSEEGVSGLTDVVPFLLESALVSLGASYTKSQDFVSYVVIDRNIVTGQNSASAKEVARKLLVSLKELPKKAEVVTY